MLLCNGIDIFIHYCVEYNGKANNMAKIQWEDEEYIYMVQLTRGACIFVKIRYKDTRETFFFFQLCIDPETTERCHVHLKIPPMYYGVEL